MKRGRAIIGVVIAGTFLCLTVSPALGDDDPLVGRWDMTIHRRDIVRTSWLEVEKKDGKYMGLFLDEGGSPGKIGEVKLEDSTVKWEWHNEEKNHLFTGVLEGDTMKGVRIDQENNKVKWTGKKVVRQLNVTGKWKLKNIKGDSQPAILLLKHQGSEIFGKLKEDSERVISEAALKGDSLTFKIGDVSYQAKIKGDMLEGAAKKAGGEELAFTGERERKWGKPIELFNGENLDGWTVMSNLKPNKWTVVDGIMSNTRSGANIVCGRKFQDFKLHVEFKIPAHSNSGVYLRGRYEIQVEDTYGKQAGPNICGSLYGRIAPSVNASAKADEWQTFDVTLIDCYVSLVHNGQKTVDNQELIGITGGAIDSDEAAPGPIYLQGDHGAVCYRKITIIPSEPITAPEGW